MICTVKQASILAVRWEGSSCCLFKRYQRIFAPLQSISKTEDVCTNSDRFSPDSRCATMPTSKSVLQQNTDMYTDELSSSSQMYAPV